MPNELYQQYMQQAPAQQNEPDYETMFQQFRQNPAQALVQSRFKIPANLQNDPNAMLSHLLQSGQISQQQLAYARQMYGKIFGRR